jgi:hypothetical protein
MRLELVRDLVPLRAAAKDRVDAAAEVYRLNFITAGAGQSMAYQEKYEEALAFLANPAIDEDEIPHIVAEVGITGPDKQAVAAVVIGMREMWKGLSAGIEHARLSAKAAIDVAATPAEIDAAAEVQWPGP